MPFGHSGLEPGCFWWLPVSRAESGEEEGGNRAAFLPSWVAVTDADLIFYQFSRSRVERGDFGDFLGLYAPDRLPIGRRLAAMMNTMMFGIEGWDDDSRELHCISEVRRFYVAFHQAWPYWLFFCNLDTDALRMMVKCCLRSITVMKVDGKPNVAVAYDGLELVRFVGNDFGPMNVMCDRAQMTERVVYDRTKAVFGYFNLPFDGGGLPPS